MAVFGVLSIIASGLLTFVVVIVYLSPSLNDEPGGPAEAKFLGVIPLLFMGGISWILVKTGDRSLAKKRSIQGMILVAIAIYLASR